MKVVSIDFSNVQSVEDLHLLLRTKLNFPEYYGMNWDAFWDSITGLVEMPDKMEITGIEYLKSWMLTDAEIFLNLLKEYNNESDLKKMEVTIKS